MKFIHTADIHLDSPLRGLSAYENAPADRLRTATRDAFEKLISRAIDEKVDFIVIAGDLYDGDWKDFNTGLFFVLQMGRLLREKIPVYLLYGNHDAGSDMTKHLKLPSNVYVFPADKANTFQMDELKVALHGRSFKTAATTDNLLPGYPDPIPGWLNIGVLHTALEGNADHARYAPCSLDELQAKGYQYWALGHVHKGWVQRGDVTIAYPGNLQGRHIRECGAHGALMVTARDGEITSLENIEEDVLRWYAIDVDITSAENYQDVIKNAGQQLEQLLENAGDILPMAVRVTFTGQSHAHNELHGQEFQLRHDVIAQALTLAPDTIWIEKVLVASQSPVGMLPGHNDEETADALNELGIMARTACDDQDFIASIQQDIQDMLGKLPRELFQEAPHIDELKKDPSQHIPEMLHQTVAVLMARLENAGNISIEPDRSQT